MSVHSVIGGNGTIGAVAVRHLAAAGCEVRIVQRHPRLIEGAVATASADVFDLDGLTKAVEGSDVMYLILGLPYDAKVWLEGFPRAVSHAVEAARRVGARLVGWGATVIRRVQSGYIYHYAFAMIFGILLLMTMWLLGAVMVQ